jgi:hypothetical protein
VVVRRPKWGARSKSFGEPGRFAGDGKHPWKIVDPEQSQKEKLF